MKVRHIIPFVFILILFCPKGFAEEVVLTVIDQKGPTEKTFTESQIRALPSVLITTFDPWDNKTRRYKGCRVLSLVETLRSPTSVRGIEVVAKNDYRATIALDDISRYNHILSFEMDGRDYAELGEDNKGPLAIAVRMEDVEKADKAKVKNQLVWWVTQIIIR